MSFGSLRTLHYTFRSVINFFFKIIYLFRERERKRQRHRQRKKQAPCREPDMGLDPGSPGSRPGLQAALNRCATRAARQRFFLKILFIYLFMIDTQREAKTQAEGEAGSMESLTWD